MLQLLYFFPNSYKRGLFNYFFGQKLNARILLLASYIILTSFSQYLLRPKPLGFCGAKMPLSHLDVVLIFYFVAIWDCISYHPIHCAFQIFNEISCSFLSLLLQIKTFLNFFTSLSMRLVSRERQNKHMLNKPSWNKVAGSLTDIM